MGDRVSRLRMVGDAVVALAAAVLTPPARRRAALARDVERHADLRIAQALRNGRTKP